MSCPCRVLDANPVKFEACCGPIIEGKTAAPTAESLMRARYTAYVKHNIDFIDASQILVEGEAFDKNEALKWAQSSEWKGLEIRKTQKGGAEDNSGVVEFVARYKDVESDREFHHHETAYFAKKDGKWKFKEGQLHAGQPLKRVEPKIGRNDPCSCGSVKKFIKCCGD